MVAFFGEIQSVFMHSPSSKFSLFLQFEETNPSSKGAPWHPRAVSTRVSGGPGDKTARRHLGVISGGSASILVLILTLLWKTQPERDVYLLPGQVNSYRQ